MRAWPRCEESYVVGPQMYHPTRRPTSGTNGTSGTSGTTGTSGTSGSAGSSGSRGSSGTSGTSGTSGLSGTSGTFSGAVNMNSNKITSLGTPSLAGDAATKGYVDALSQGLSTKQSVIASTTTNGTLATAYANGSVIDGITLATGNRILIKVQTAQSENGIYTVNASGSPTRAADFAAASSASGTYVFTERGSANIGAGFVCTSVPDSDIVGTNNIIFTQFSGAGQIIASTGLSKSGNTLSVNATQTQITSIGALASLTTGQITSTVTTGTPPLVITSTTNVPNLNAGSVNGATFGSPGSIGSSSPGSAAFTTVSASSAITSTVSTGIAPLVIASTTAIPNLNASLLGGATFASPGAIGSTTASSGAFTTGTYSGAVGIGAAVPTTSSLYVAGAITSTPSGNGVHAGTLSNYSVLQLNNSAGGYVDFSPDGEDARGRIVYVHSTNSMALSTNTGVGLLTIDSTGNTSVSGAITAKSAAFSGTSSGVISVLPQAAAGTYNLNLPITVGTKGFGLTSGGGGSTAMTWQPQIFANGFFYWTGSAMVTVGSHNCTITRTGTGNYTVTFTTQPVNAQYVITLGYQAMAASNQVCMYQNVAQTSFLIVYFSGGTATDNTFGISFNCTPYD